jgi:hypothetical protein
MVFQNSSEESCLDLHKFMALDIWNVFVVSPTSKLK